MYEINSSQEVLVTSFQQPLKYLPLRGTAWESSPLGLRCSLLHPWGLQ